MYTQVKTNSEIEAMRVSGGILARVLDTLEQTIAEGMNCLEIDHIARREAKALGGETPFLGYGSPPFPGAICISLNDEIEHGTPRDIVLRDGDVVSLDFGIRYNGMISDSGRTLVIGDAPSKVTKLIEATEQSLYAGIAKVRDGAKIGDISAAVEAVLAKGRYGIVRDLVGHGVGHELHEDPNIPNYGTAGKGPMLKAGMTIAIEPMATLGDWRIKFDDDHWTIRTADGSLAAHFEHTVLVTESGAEVMTLSNL